MLFIFSSCVFKKKYLIAILVTKPNCAGCCRFEAGDKPEKIKIPGCKTEGCALSTSTAFLSYRFFKIYHLVFFFNYH